MTSRSQLTPLGARGACRARRAHASSVSPLDSSRWGLSPPGSPAARSLCAQLEAERQSLLPTALGQEAPEDRLELRTIRLPSSQPRQRWTEMGRKVFAGLPARHGCRMVAAVALCRNDTCYNSESLGSAPELPVERRVGAGVIACSGLGLAAGEQKPASQCPQHSSHLVWMTATPAAQPEHLLLPADLCSGHFLSPNWQPAQKWNHPALHLTAEETGALRGLVSCPRSQSRERAVKA